jgi:hypothetical protein
MLGQVVVLLGHQHTLAEEVLVDPFAVGFGDEPKCLAVSMRHGGTEIEGADIVASSWRYSGNRIQCVRGSNLKLLRLAFVEEDQIEDLGS